MDLSDFDQLFTALTEREPYPWQRRLYQRFMGASGESRAVPGRLDLPTGLGKTSAMAVWLAARINGADLPRRLVYVVDRRAVVDQATAEAERLAWNLDELLKGEHSDEILRSLKLRPVRAETKGELAALPISTLRGQFLDNRRWFDDPASAAIVVGTVDMVGSRLLFSGYGVSRWMRPVHAALLGLDSLVLLDEAHLAQPFEAMLQGAARLIAEDVTALEGDRPAALRPLKVLGLSATGAPREGEDVFALDDEDRTDGRTAARLTAAKSLRLEPEVAPGKLAETLVDLAWDMRVGEDGSARRVVVFCNSRRTAQLVEGLLEKRAQAKDAYGKGAKLTALLVGERRFREREQLADDPVFRRFWAGEPQAPGAEPAFLVATSAGEVGVDLDADDLVCDLVAWERMVQRLGRVNRRPVPGTARVRVVPVAGDKEAEDEIDTDALKRLRAPFDCGLWETDA
jgi:CRISPR-associated endonuclease/helicase Cas3